MNLIIEDTPSGESTVFYQNRYLYSKFKPSRSALSLIMNEKFEQRVLYFIPSPLLGYGLEELLAKLPQESPVLAIETDQNLMALSQSYIQPFLNDSRFFYFRLDNTNALYESFSRVIAKYKPRKIKMLSLSGGVRLNKDLYQIFYSNLQGFLQTYWKNRYTLNFMGSLWIKNLFENLAQGKIKDISQFKTDKNIILCGAGESLEKSIPFIRQNRQALFILAVDTAIPSLISFNIIPDGVVNLEAQFYNLKDFYPLRSHKTILFSDLTAYPASLRPEKWEHYTFCSNFGNTTLLTRLKEAQLLPTLLPPLGSVGVTALYLAKRLTTKNIYITGLDFSFIRGKSHAKESPFHDWARLEENRLTGDRWIHFSLSRPSTPVEDRGKNPNLYSDSILEGYARQLKDFAQTYEGIIDIREQGLDLGLDQEYKKISQSIKFNSLCTQITIKKLEQFIIREYNSLLKLLVLWDKYTKKETQGASLLEALKELDYLYFDFPDAEQLPNLNSQFLFRTITKAREYKNHFEKRILNSY